MFAYYGDELLLRYNEAGFPQRFSDKRVEHWWARNLGHRDLVVISMRVLHFYVLLSLP